MSCKVFFRFLSRLRRFEFIKLTKAMNNVIYFSDSSGDMSNDLFELPETDCLLFNTGVVNCVPAIKFVSKCDVDYTYWPYDQQKCRFVLGSWSHTGEEIDFHLDGDGVRELLEKKVHLFISHSFFLSLFPFSSNMSFLINTYL